MSAALQEAVGRTETAKDVLSSRLLAQFRASFAEELHDPDPLVAPVMAHWLMAPATVPKSETGADGHPRTGGFLPAVPLPRRMWASGSLHFVDSLREGDEVSRHTMIRSVERKLGQSGEMWFVSLSHEVFSPRGLALTEEQTIVYRAADAKSAAPPAASLGPDRTVSTVHVDELRLFRYSALTFNGHRIHYDRPYACDVEGYAGLVTHGPLQATILANAASRELARMKRFSFRATSPLIAPSAADVRLARTDGELALCICAPDGSMTMTAKAS